MSRLEGATVVEVREALADQIRGKNVLITGVTVKSIGLEFVRHVAKYAGIITIAGRTQSKLDKSKEEILAQNSEAQIQTLLIDLSSFESIRRAAADFNQRPEPVHVLINSAAIFPNEFSKTVDDYENQLQTNHLGPFLFTALIYQHIIASATFDNPVRIINVSSGLHFRSPFIFEDLTSPGREPEGSYNKWTTYGSTKTANILFSRGLYKRALAKKQPVLVFSLTPGLILTNLNANIPEEEFVSLGLKNKKGEWTGVKPGSIDDGAKAYIAAAFDPEIAAKNGAFFSMVTITEPASHATDEEIVERLWELSEKAVGQKFVV